jgi:hypothetical protein
MPEEHDERAGFGEPDDFTEANEFDDLDDLDEDEPGDAGRARPAPGYPAGGYPAPPGGWRRGGRDRLRRGLPFAVTALVAGATAFGVVTVAVHDAAAIPTAASSTPSSGAPSGGTPSGGTPSGGTPTDGAGRGTQLAPNAGGAVPSVPSGATLRVEIGGPVTAVSATSITLGGGGREVTAAVTAATKVTGKVTSIGGVKVGDVVSATITDTNGKLTATSIQDPASLPPASAQ